MNKIIPVSALREIHTRKHNTTTLYAYLEMPNFGVGSSGGMVHKRRVKHNTDNIEYERVYPVLFSERDDLDMTRVPHLDIVVLTRRG